MIRTCGIVGLLAFAGAANATVFNEVEDNSSAAAANFLGSFTAPGDSVVIDGRITRGDVDWFRFDVDAGTQVVSASFGRPNSDVGDSILTLVAADGVTIITQDDDSGIGLFSAIEAQVPAGTYYLVITAFPDFDLEGDHDDNFSYKLIMGLNIPGPSSLALLGMGGAVAIRRRRA